MDRINSEVKNYKLAAFNKDKLNSNESLNIINGIKDSLENTKDLITEVFDFGSESYDVTVDDYSSMFGGYQGELYRKFERYCDDENIHKIMKKYFGDDYSIEDMELLFYRINKIGCGYVAMSNVIMEELSSKYTNKELEKMFGFPVVTEFTIEIDDGYEQVLKQHYHEYLILDFFLFYATKIEGYKTIEEVYGNTKEEINFYANNSDAALDDYEIERTGQRGIRLNEASDVLREYLNEKDCDIKVINDGKNFLGPFDLPEPSKLDAKLVKTILEKGDKLVIGAVDFTLYSSEDVDGNGKLDDIVIEDVGSHGMNVIGISGDGKFLVDSWGKKFLLDPSEVSDEFDMEVIHSYTIYQFNSNN